MTAKGGLCTTHGIVAARDGFTCRCGRPLRKLSGVIDCERCGGKTGAARFCAHCQRLIAHGFSPAPRLDRLQRGGATARKAPLCRYFMTYRGRVRKYWKCGCGKHKVEHKVKGETK